MEQLAIFDASGAPIAPPHATSARRGHASEACESRCRNSPTPLARNSDPATSHAAAQRAEGFAASHRQRIIAALAQPGTIKDLAARTGIDHVAIARRMGECERMGLAYPTEEKRDGCRVWARCR